MSTRASLLALGSLAVLGCSSRLSDRDITRYCMAQVDCPVAESVANCTTRLETARELAQAARCSGQLASLVRCQLENSTCSTTGCEEQASRLETCGAARDVGTRDALIGLPDAFRVDARGDAFVAGGEGAIRQTGGFLEVFHAGEWRGVCDDSFDANDGEVVCRQLGGTYVRYQSSVSGSGAFWLDDVDCTGSEARLAECDSAGWGVDNCSGSEHVLVVCE